MWSTESIRSLLYGFFRRIIFYFRVSKLPSKRKILVLKIKIPPLHEKEWREINDSRRIVMSVTVTLSTKESNLLGLGWLPGLIFYIYLLCLVCQRLSSARQKPIKRRNFWIKGAVLTGEISLSPPPPPPLLLPFPPVPPPQTPSCSYTTPSSHSQYMLNIAPHFYWFLSFRKVAPGIIRSIWVYYKYSMHTWARLLKQ